MTLQLSVAVRNALLDAIETAVGPSPILRIYDLTAAAPANCAAAITGTVLAEMTLPVDWMAAASNGTKVMAGSWSDLSGDAAGIADFFRIYASDGVTCHNQGTVTATGAGGDLTLNNTNIAVGQPVTITQYTLPAPNA